MMSLTTIELETKTSPRPRSTPLTVKDFKGKAEPDWCPGCGDFGVLTALKQALVELAIQPHQAMVISGIGCSSNLPGYISTYGMHTLHGRALSVATGAQMANHELKIIVTGGDGDGYGIGGNHFVHSMRRNVDLTYIVMNNQIYGLTTGQLSPTSAKGMKTKSTPMGSVENPINPIPLAIAAGATYVARGYTGQVKHLVELIKGGIEHRGFALIDVISPCVSFNDHDGSTKSYAYMREHEMEAVDADFVPLRREIVLPEDHASVTVVQLHDGSTVRLRSTTPDYSPTDREKAYRHVRSCQKRGEVATGLLFIDQSGHDMHHMSKTVDQPLVDLPFEQLKGIKATRLGHRLRYGASIVTAHLLAPCSKDCRRS